MRSILFQFIFLLSSFVASSQSSFQKGYFINSSGERTECLIKNKDWRYSPTNFSYRLSATDEIINVDLNSIKEFGGYNLFKFIKATIQNERSSSVLGNLSTSFKPKFETETVFLEVLVEGKANLYSYQSNNLSNYFYSIDNDSIIPLVYKTYLKRHNINENNTYREQILNALPCSSMTFKDLQKIQYNSKSLRTTFIDYNTCIKTPFKTYRNQTENERFNFSIKTGLNYGSLKFDNGNINYNKSVFDKNLSIRFGFEMEYVMDFNNSKWSIFVEPNYQYYKQDTTREPKSISINTPVQFLKAEHESIEIPFGIRYYMHFNEYSKLFLNASYIPDFSINSNITYENGSIIEYYLANRIGLGIGYKYNNIYSVEVRWVSDLNSKKINSANYSYVSLNLGCRIFNL